MILIITADIIIISKNILFPIRCLSNGEVPPTKERLEYPPPETNTGLTQGWYFPNQNFHMFRYLLFIIRVMVG